MFAHTDPLFKNLHILKAEDIFKIQHFKFYYRHLKHTLPTFFLNLQFRINEHNYNTRNQDVYKCRIYMNLLDSAYYIIYPMQSITAQQI